MKYLPILLLLTGCSAAERLLPVCDGETDCAAIRCTDYTAQAVGYFTSSSGSVTGRQVTFYGPVPENTTVEPEDCKITVGDNDQSTH